MSDRALRRTGAVGVSLKSLASFDGLGVEFSIEDLAGARCGGRPMIAADQASAAEEKIMTKAMGFVSALIFALGTAPAARAQVMLDVSKITCEQFAGYKITTPQNIAIWLSGYYNGKQSNTVIDMQKFMENTKALERYCIQNPQILVMKAGETVFGSEK